jgi:tripartite-type tricarboxylate transporter receptor subunit TctC
VEESDMTIGRREFLYLAGGCALAPIGSAWAQQWPARPVRTLVGYPAGITPDTVTRFISARLSERIGQQFIVENRPGAGASLAAEQAVRSQPDGYTLLLAAAANTINTSLYPKLSFNFNRDLAPVASIGGVVFIMVAHPSVPAKTLPEFIAYAKANPGKINMASRGIGSLTHVFGELFKMMAGVDLVHVPYNADYTTDLLSGRVQVAFNAVAESAGYIKDGRLTALGITTAKRFADLPNIPTISESLPGYETSGWLGIVAPRATPESIVERLNGNINSVVAEPAIQKRLAGMGVAPMSMSGAAFGKFMAAETEKWAKVIKFAKIKV